MAEEQVNPPELAEDVPLGERELRKEAGDRRGGKRENRKTPEELYDLSQPIPKMQQPDKALHEKELDAINHALEALKREKLALQTQIDAASNPLSRNTAFGAERELIQQLQQQKSTLIEEKKALWKRMDEINVLLEKLVNERKTAKVQVRFDSLAKIDDEIQKLKRLQQSTSMSLTDEKKLVKEIDQLQSSKIMFAELDANHKKVEGAKDMNKSISAEIKIKDVAIDAVKKEIDDRRKALESLGDSEKEAKEQRKKLLDQREGLKKKIADVYKELDQVRDKFRQDTDAWFDYQRAVKAQEKLKKDEERKKRHGSIGTRRAKIMIEKR